MSSILKRCVKHFGTTEDPFEAGYLLPDGRFLDLSGKNEGGRPSQRARDHREVAFCFPDGYPRNDRNDSRMLQFIEETNSIRMSAFKESRSIPRCTSVNIQFTTANKPTPAQLSALREMESTCPEFYYDVTMANGSFCPTPYEEFPSLSKALRTLRRCKKDG